ncbi:MAG: alpha/beta hydrolase fold domain-containing protein [Rubripirellula sp.]
MKRIWLAILGLFCVTLPLPAQEAANAKVVRDIEYAHRDGGALKLDLYLPKDPSPPVPCVVFVHGGGWKNGDKKSGQKNAAWLTDQGFAVASINYRLTDVARWPAQINDCYDAVRWVRQNAKQYGIAPDSIGAFGTSAGAHLAILMGTRKCPEPESVSSKVQAVCDWFGPSELLSMPPNNVGDGRTEVDIAKSNGALLLGSTVRDVPSLAKDASGIDHVSSDDADFLIMHGADDPGVPVPQSTDLHARLVQAGVPSELKIIPGAKHGGKEFHTDDAHQTVLRFFQRTLAKNWSEGAGPQGNFGVQANAPTKWSVVRDENIVWRKTLPETGQSTVVSWGDRIFFTTMQEVEADSGLGSNIVAWCCDARTGETVWRRDVTAQHPLRLSGCFSDSSSPPPVTDGKRVVFFNASGKIAAFDLEGKPRWKRDIMPVGRTQPTVVDDTVVFIKQTYMPDEHGHFTHDHKDAPLEEWTQFHALNLATGEDVWTSTCGSNMGCVPLIQTRSDGKRVFVLGRGGGHSPPEKPEGISMIDATTGTTLWTLPLQKFMSTMTFNLHGDHVLVFHGPKHLWVNAMTGKISREVSITHNFSFHSHQDGEWSGRDRHSLRPSNKGREIIQQSNVLVGRYHYFRSYTQPWLGRVDVNSGQVEYLQLPVQLRRKRDSKVDELLWHWSEMDPQFVQKLLAQKKKPPKELPITQWAFEANDMKNSRNLEVVGDARSRGNGWGHHASQLPTAIGKHLYIPTMAGTVYVLRWDANVLDQSAIVAINDLGKVGQAWNRASLSTAGNRLLAHTIREVICIGTNEQKTPPE